ncbi:hypothetical protein [Halobacterium zhouii]|uniref:hypothetical protein n=1 Tax=Halobacterium zhouii TaxID=2902624 RepID=UPI001E45D563|nr:hypothetical protein [Halobacterium zhouii]
MSTRQFERHGERLLAALAYPLTSVARTLAFVVTAAATYVLLVLSSFPAYSMQMVSADVWYLDDAVVALTANTYATIGAVGFALVVAYAIVTGVAVTNAVGRLRHVGVSGTGGLMSVAPGLLVSGCASCGAGVLGLLGFAGALATMPFHGNLLRAGGLLLLFVYLARAGDPSRCDIE